MFRPVLPQMATAFTTKLSTRWQHFTVAVDKHRWATYSTFLLILIIFILLLPRACNYP
jgi:hypothetical protein